MEGILCFLSKTGHQGDMRENITSHCSTLHKTVKSRSLTMKHNCLPFFYLITIKQKRPSYLIKQEATICNIYSQTLYAV